VPALRNETQGRYIDATGVFILRFLIDYVGIAATRTCPGAGCSPQ